MIPKSTHLTDLKKEKRKKKRTTLNQTFIGLLTTYNYGAFTLDGC
jgi:hypothetical protein